MTYLLTTVIAIVLLSAVIVVSFTYFSTDEANAVGNSRVITAQMGNLVEASQAFYRARGYYPANLADLRSEIDIEPISMTGAEFVISNGIACISMPYNEGANMTLENASQRISGSVVGNVCGNSGITNRRFLAISLDGVNQPVGEPFS